ncbi:hypothetical protein GCM10029992_29390 [Glycomyces albus]
MDVGGVAEDGDDLEGGGLLAEDAVEVQVVDQGDRVVLGELVGDGEAVVEVAVELEELRAVDEGLGELAEGDLPGRDEHGASDPGAGGVGRGRGRGVAGGGADDGLGVRFDGLGDGQGHAAVLERTGRVEPFDLQVDVATGLLGQDGAGSSGVPPSWSVTTGWRR